MDGQSDHSSSVDYPRNLPAPHVLAYVGDAVYELYVRRHVAMRGRALPLRRLHREVVALVRAEAQAEALRRLGPLLTPEERDIARRGRNAASGSAGTQPPAVRRAATAFEALVGYLYWTGRRERLEELLGPLICQDGGALADGGGQRHEGDGSDEGTASTGEGEARGPAPTEPAGADPAL